MKPLKCELCDQNNSQYCNLQHHVGSVHEGKKQLKCETCDTTSSVKGDLKKHIPSDHKSKKLFKCESYLDDCAQDCGLQRSVHEGKSPFKSEFLDKSNSQKKK